MFTVKNVVDFDFAYDFKEVKEYVIREQLSVEDIEDGLEPEEINLKVCLTKHVLDRMEGTYGRQCEWVDIEDLILAKAHKLFEVKSGEEIAIVNETKTLVLFCQIYLYKGELVMKLKTVVRKVIVVNNKEIEKRVWVNQKTRQV